MPGFTNVELKAAEEEDPDKEADEVISVSPKEGATAAKSAKVTVTYATGKSPVPNFIGRPSSAPATMPKAAGFDSVQVVEEETNERPGRHRDPTESGGRQGGRPDRRHPVGPGQGVPEPDPAADSDRRPPAHLALTDANHLADLTRDAWLGHRSIRT